MALDLGRWFRYAQAKVNDVVRSSDEELARREAARELETAERPWLADDATAPSLETAKARIAWEAEQARRSAEEGAAEGGDDQVDGDAPTSASVPNGSTDTDLGRFGTDEAEAAQARIELDQRARASAERLEAIRRELGVDRSDDAEGDPTEGDPA